MKILITGASGYLGANIIKYLFANGHDTIACCRKLSPSKEKKLRDFNSNIIQGDILDEITLIKARESRPDIVIHLASLDQKESETNIDKATRVNVLSTWKLLDTFQDTSLSKFIYFSTIQVLGHLAKGLISEDYKINPRNNYALTHLLSEQIMDFYRSKSSFQPLTIRLANGYGSPVFPDNNCWWLVVNDLCRMAFHEGKIVLQSDGRPLRDFIHLNDINQALAILIETPNNLLRNTYHLASSNTYSILELALSIKQIFKSRYNRDIPVITSKGVFSEDSTITMDNKYKLDISSLESLGFHPALGIEQGIHELFNYFDQSN